MADKFRALLVTKEGNRQSVAVTEYGLAPKLHCPRARGALRERLDAENPLLAGSSCTRSHTFITAIRSSSRLTYKLPKNTGLTISPRAGFWLMQGKGCDASFAY